MRLHHAELLRDGGSLVAEIEKADGLHQIWLHAGRVAVDDPVVYVGLTHLGPADPAHGERFLPRSLERAWLSSLEAVLPAAAGEPFAETAADMAAALRSRVDRLEVASSPEQALYGAFKTLGTDVSLLAALAHLSQCGTAVEEPHHVVRNLVKNGSLRQILTDSGSLYWAVGKSPESLSREA